jgi:hypothetical protein
MPREYPNLVRELSPPFLILGFFMDGIEFHAYCGM